MSTNHSRIDSPSRPSNARPPQRLRNGSSSSSSSSTSEIELGGPPPNNGEGELGQAPGFFALDHFASPIPVDHRLIPFFERITEVSMQELMEAEYKAKVRYLDLQLLRIIAPDSSNNPSSKANLYYNRMAGSRVSSNAKVSYKRFFL